MRRGEIFWGVLLFIVGLLFLIGNFIDINVWALLGPGALIVAGAWILWLTLRKPSPLETEMLAIPLEDDRQVRLRIQYGAGRLNVNAGADAGMLLSGAFDGGVESKVRRDADWTDVRLRIPETVLSWPHYTQPRTWAVALSEALPLHIDVESGATETRLDLTDLHVTRLNLGTGASSTEVWLPAWAGHTDVRVGAGAASVILHVPEGVAARIESKVALASLHIDQGRFPRDGNVYQSPHYETAENRVAILLEAGVGSFDVR